MDKFSFISDEEFRKIFIADYSEMNSCAEAKAWKSVMIISGSIIEALLIDSLVNSNMKEYPKSKLLRIDLNKAITLCSENGILSDKAKNLSDVVRNYRNLIHPGKIIRMQENPSEQDATIAKSLVDIILRELSAVKEKTYGYTAEQILMKVVNDSSSMPIWSSLLKKVNDIEKERLILQKISEEYFRTIQDGQKNNSDPSSTLHRLTEFFRFVYTKVNDETKKKAANKFVVILANGYRGEVEHYLNSFFRSEYLKFMNYEDKEMTNRYLFSTLSKGVSKNVLNSISGLLSFLKKEELESFISVLLNQLLYSKMSKDLYSKYEEFLCQEYRLLKKDRRLIIMNEIEEKKEWVSKKQIDQLEQLKSYMANELSF